MSVHAWGLVPAAGKSERFGSMKLLADVRGEPLLNHTLRSLLDAGLERVVLVLSPNASLSTVALLHDSRVRVVVNPDPDRGMFSSIQVGLGASAAAELVAILPGDTPFVTSATVTAVLAHTARTRRPAVPSYRGRHGHPLALPADLVAPLLGLDPHSSLKAALASIGATRDEVDVDDPGVVRDIDTRADLGLPPS